MTEKQVELLLDTLNDIRVNMENISTRLKYVLIPNENLSKQEKAHYRKELDLNSWEWEHTHRTIGEICFTPTEKGEKNAN